MRPEQGSDIIKIPVTFDSGGGSSRVRQAGVRLWLFLIAVLWLLISIISIVMADSINGYLTPLYTLFILSFLVRYVVLREHFFRARRKNLIEHNFMFAHTVFWNIFEISERLPHMVTFENGVKGVFVAFDKGVVIGRGEHSDYYHHEALADAYQQVLNKGIEMIHIDYMDVVGKDKRMEHLFTLAENTKNPEIRKVLTMMYDHTEQLMNSHYATYDVYVFLARGREEQFWAELEKALSFFRNANYLRYRLLNRESISQLVETLMNVHEFSVNRTNHEVMSKLNNFQKFITVIWTEKDGQRKVLNKTQEEQAEAKRVATNEKGVKKKGNILTRRKEKPEDNQDINLFGVGFEEEDFSKIKQEANDRKPTKPVKQARPKKETRPKTKAVPPKQPTHSNDPENNEEDIDLFS